MTLGLASAVIDTLASQAGGVDLAITTTHAVIAPILVALITAIATLATRRRAGLQRAVSLLGVGGYATAVAWLGLAVAREGIVVYQLSAWPAPFGITLVADALSAFMLAIAAAIALPSLVFSVLQLSAYGQRVAYHTLFHFLLVGVSGAFLTGDVFNLFVWFEVMLLPTYLLVGYYSGPSHTYATLQYTVLNLVGSAVMLVAIGGLYATTGTLNMADMARRLANAGQYGIDPAPVLGIATLLLSVFALKAGLVPFQFWVPAAYRAAPAPVTAMLAAVTKKVGIYAIIRLTFTVFAAGSLPAGLTGLSGESFLGFLGPALFLMAAASILLGGIGAVNRPDFDGVLAYSSISQAGFILLPLAIAATAPSAAIAHLGIAAALVYALNHSLAKALLFLASGSLRDATGSDRFDDLGGLLATAPVMSLAVLVGGLALIGIPPLTGFFGKLFVLDTAGQTVAAAGAGGTMALGVALVGAVLSIAYVSRAWNLGFWGDPTPAVRNATWSPAQIAVIGALAVAIVLLGVGFEPVFRAADAGADAALSADGGYVDAVLPGVAG